MVWTQRRTVTLIVGEPAPSVVRIVYGVSNGSPRDWWSWNRTFVIPPDGIVHTLYPMDLGWYRPENPHPLRVLQRRDSRDTIELPGAWVRGGFAKSSNCDLDYDEYVIGLNEATSVEWLDSLHLWQVECKDGRLLRSLGGISNVAPPRQLCIYSQGGGLECRNPATVP